jgi:hypothetical protein
MFFYFSKPFFLLFISLLFCGFSNGAFANTTKQVDSGWSEPNIALDSGNELKLEVRKMPMDKVLKAIANKANISIHSSVLPMGLVTATCIGTVKNVLECLLDGKADLIVRYPKNNLKNETNGQIAEAWILGSRVDGNQPLASSCAGSGSEKTAVNDFPAPNQNHGVSVPEVQAKNDDEVDPGRTAELLKMAQSKTPSDRAEAIGELLAEESQDDPNVAAVLEQALTDKDPSVRAQAISSFAHREGVDATSALQQALNDSSEDVRLMAVDSITDNAALLQQASNDSDETVRSLATVKLAQLNQNNAVSK